VDSATSARDTAASTERPNSDGKHFHVWHTRTSRRKRGLLSRSLEFDLFVEYMSAFLVVAGSIVILS
jgi:hypothetical protein